MSRLCVLLSLALCHLQGAESFPGVGWFTEVLIDNAGTAGLPYPGYVSLLSRKSGFLTKILHLIFGNYFEDQFKHIMETAVEQMQDSAPIENVDNDNPERLTFLNGKMTGLKSIQVVPDTKVEIIWHFVGFPIAIGSVQFKDLRVNADINTKFTLKTVDGNADIKFLENNFVLKFHLHPGIFERCYLRLFDVICTDLEDMLWTVRRKDGTVDNLAGSLMQGYFTSKEGEVEEHIKTSIANVIFTEIPKASPAICDNTAKFAKLSKYQTFKKANKDSKRIMEMLQQHEAKQQQQQQTTNNQAEKTFQNIEED